MPVVSYRIDPASLDRTFVGMEATPVQPQDTEAVAFLQKFQRAIYYGIRLEHVPEQDVDDVFQDVALHIVEAFRKQPERPDHCLSFAVTVARHRAISHLRKSRRHRVPDQVVPEHVAGDLNALDRIIKLEGHQRLHACVEMLSIMRREVMRRRIRGVPFAEIAGELNLTVPSAKVLAHRATNDLRRMLTNPRYC